MSTTIHTLISGVVIIVLVSKVHILVTLSNFAWCWMPSGVNPKLAYFTHTCVRGFVATPPLYSDTYVYHYVYICGVQPSADTSFSVLME